MGPAESYVDRLRFNEDDLDQDGIMRGGFPMSSIIEQENLSNQMLGGGKSISKARFADLVIPLSLDTHYEGENGESTIEIKPKKNKMPSLLDEDRFKHVFDSIIVTKKRREKETRKNTANPISKPTRKAKAK
jgi:hypothetical protein